jgi:hypothetical protein
VGSLQTYKLSLPPVKKLKTIALKASKKKVEASSEDDSEEEDKVVAMLAKNFRRLMKDDRFKKKFYDKIKKPLREAEPEEDEEILEDPDVLNAQALGISGRIVGISKRTRGRLTM